MKATALIVAGMLAAVVAVSATAGPPRVRGKVSVEGTVTSVHLAASTFALRLTAGRPGGETLIVLVQEATALSLQGTGGGEDGAARRRASIRNLRVGDQVKLEGFRLDDGRVLALRLTVRNRSVGRSTRNVPNGAVSGVVTAKSENTVVISGEDAASPRAIVILPTTEFRGLRTSFGAIRLGDLIVVQGSVNSDGSVSARSVDTSLAGGTTLRGRITARSQADPSLLILDHRLAVNLSAGTRVISAGQLRSPADLDVGQVIAVTGIPIIVGGVTIGINARVITF